MKQVGIMGGSFDPPHIGHIAIARCVMEALDLEQIRFMPTGQVSYKERSLGASCEDRVEMVRLAIKDEPKFCLDDRETKRRGCSYTYETVEELKGAEPDANFTFIVGADSLDYMERWRNPERIFRCCRIAAVIRPGFSQIQMEEKRQGLIKLFDAEIALVKAPEIPVSSTEVRQNLLAGDGIEAMVSPAVAAYIYHKGLYRK